ncbi:hypothetical protein CFBP6109_02787 [Pseudomonas syringae pv. cerasicola]|nr:hypothetical protein BVY10_03415 [Pseudomonas amygdali pv. morsprunorum]SOS17987.1 hypothetical protein CFBP6109_02787 [Pseudomonas syringae pv. cerasicola]SPF15046.1 hypothetical protein PSCFBP6110_02549 [Pseudomonas syringae pv. cerasicola]
MNVHCRRSAPFMLAAMICLGGCTGHFKFSDDQYRALGSPEPTSRNEVVDESSVGLLDIAHPRVSAFYGRELS